MDYRSFSDAALLDRLRELAAREHGAVSDFVACLAEADRRAGAILGEGCPSLFDFCVRDLKLAESTAYKRVKAAKLVHARPEILALLADGSINLSNLCLIAKVLEEHPGMLARIVGKTKREVEALVASFGVPREVPDRIRPLPPSVPASAAVESLFFRAPPPAQAEGKSSSPPPSGPSSSHEPRTEFRFAAGPRFVDVVERLRALLWHKHPSGRLEDLLYEAASDFVARRDPIREPRTSTSRSAPSHSRRSRRIPTAVRRAVWRRDAGRCSYAGRPVPAASRGAWRSTTSSRGRWGAGPMTRRI